MPFLLYMAEILDIVEGRGFDHIFLHQLHPDLIHALYLPTAAQNFTDCVE